MNKLIIVIALTAACVALAEANKFNKGHHVFDEGDFNDFDHFGNHGGIHGGHLGPFRGRHGRYHGRHGRRHGGFGGRRGGLGGFHKQGAGFGAIGSHNNEFQNNDFDNQQGGLIAGANRFDHGHHIRGHNDQDGIHKHQGFNKDKTIIKDHESGINDVDGFHNSQGFNEGDHSSGSSAGLAAGGSATHLGNTRASESDLGAIGAVEGSSSGLEI